MDIFSNIAQKIIKEQELIITTSERAGYKRRFISWPSEVGTNSFIGPWLGMRRATLKFKDINI